MEQNSEHINLKLELKKALSIIEMQSAIILQSQSTIQQLQLKIEQLTSINEKLLLKQQDLAFQLAQLQKLVFGSRHEKFVASDAQMVPTLFDIPAIPELLQSTTISYERAGKQSRSNHPGRNSFPEHLRREERIVNPAGIDTALAKKMGEDVTETLAYTPAELFVKKVIRPKYLDVATNSIYQALAPERSFERSNVDTSLIVDIPLQSTPRFRYKVPHSFRFKLPHDSAVKDTSYSGVKYPTLYVSCCF